MRISPRSVFNLLCMTFAVYTLVFILQVFTPTISYHKPTYKEDLENFTYRDASSRAVTTVSNSNIHLGAEENNISKISDAHLHKLDWKLLEDMFFKINHKEALLFGKFRRKSGFLTIGIPSVKRKDVSYIETTLDSLVMHTPPQEQEQVVIVVFFTDSNHTWVVKRATEIYHKYKTYVDSGFMQIVHPPHIAYPNFKYLERKFNDSSARVAWRSKQNLDYSYLMTYTRNISKYYIQLEDDVITTSGYLGKIKNFIAYNLKKTWLFLRFSGLGFIGVLFKSSDLPKVAEFLLVLFDESPGDLLINDLKKIKGQAKDYRSRPSLFQHLGLVSSLENKIQKIQDRDFPGYRKRKEIGWTPDSPNPNAEIHTNMDHYKNFQPEAAYFSSARNYFWTVDPKNGSFFRIIFQKSINISSISIYSGNSKHPDDKLTSSTSVSVSNVGKEGGEKCAERKNIGKFENGEFHYNVTNYHHNIKCVSIDINEDQTTWVILRDIFIKTKT